MVAINHNNIWFLTKNKEKKKEAKSWRVTSEILNWNSEIRASFEVSPACQVHHGLQKGKIRRIIDLSRPPHGKSLAQWRAGSSPSPRRWSGRRWWWTCPLSWGPPPPLRPLFGCSCPARYKVMSMKLVTLCQRARVFIGGCKTWLRNAKHLLEHSRSGS